MRLLLAAHLLLVLCTPQFVFVRTLISKTPKVAPAAAAHDNMQLSQLLHHQITQSSHSMQLSQLIHGCPSAASAKTSLDGVQFL
jgi:hypothetical protein